MDISASDNRMTNLKPCPFCGGKAYSCGRFQFGNQWWVGCHRCGARTALYDKHETAEHKWNVRHCLLEFGPPVQLTRVEATMLDILNDATHNAHCKFVGVKSYEVVSRDELSDGIWDTSDKDDK